MTWEIAAVIVAALAATVAALHICLPYLRKRSDAETRLLALEEANKALMHELAASRVELSERLAHVEQFAAGGGPLGRLPRAGVVR